MIAPKMKILVIISLILNLVFVSVLTTFLIRRGGINYLSAKFSQINVSHRKAQPVPTVSLRHHTYLTAYYRMKVKNFSAMPHSQKDIIFLGDSLTDQGEWTEFLENPHIKNRGISGDTTDGVIQRLSDITQHKPHQIFIMIGTNDFWNEQKSVTLVVQNYKTILEKIKKETPKTQVFVMSILPVNNQKFKIKIDPDDMIDYNAQLAKLAHQFSFQYIDLYDKFLNEQNQLDPRYTLDGVHLNIHGYSLWARLIAPYLNR
jgi:lysophospholipase L1-like esterase